MSERLTVWNGKKWVLPQGKGAFRMIAEKLADYENREEIPAVPTECVKDIIIALYQEKERLLNAECATLDTPESISDYVKGYVSGINSTIAKLEQLCCPEIDESVDSGEVVLD